MSIDLDSYNTVPERIVEFAAKYPEGSLQRSGDLQFVSYAGADWVIYTAAAYRHPDDPRPGIGTAWERIPGTTPYTKGSEVQNAETSAWGRAIVAVLAADTRKGVATAEEVRLAQTRQEPVPQRDWIAEANEKATAEEVRGVWREAKQKRAPVEVLDKIAVLGRERADAETVDEQTGEVF